MAESKEFQAVTNCFSDLNNAFSNIDTETVYYLNKEGFISKSMCEQVLNQKSSLTAAEKAIQLVSSIRNRIRQSPQEYHKLVDHLEWNRKQYGCIVEALNTEYSRLGKNIHLPRQGLG